MHSQGEHTPLKFAQLRSWGHDNTMRRKTHGAWAAPVWEEDGPTHVVLVTATMWWWMQQGRKEEEDGVGNGWHVIPLTNIVTNGVENIIHPM